MAPTWLVGISIGAVNATLIAGNPPERWIERLSTFWDRVSTYATLEPPAWLESLRPVFGRFKHCFGGYVWNSRFFTPQMLNPLFARASNVIQVKGGGLSVCFMQRRRL